MTTFLQLLKETGVRCGEASQLLWTDVDTVDCSIIVTPEKGSNTRKLKISNKLVAMLNKLLKDAKIVFNANSDPLKRSFTLKRRHIAFKLKSQRLKQITFHTFRHWKATQLYHETKDPYYVKDLLGHKELRNTEIYINIERTVFEPSGDGFTVKVTDNAEEVKSLLKVGFEYVCQKDNLIFLRKRK